MSKRTWLSGVVLGAVLVIPFRAEAQMWSSEQQEVWSVIVESWSAIAAKDVTWSDRWVHPNAIVWGDQNPTPRNRASVKKWDRFEFSMGTVVVHEQNPLAIVVQGNTAIGYYYFSQGMESTSGEMTTVHGRCADILIREGGRWQFIGWRCGTTPTDDE